MSGQWAAAHPLPRRWFKSFMRKAAQFEGGGRPLAGILSAAPGSATGKEKRRRIAPAPPILNQPGRLLDDDFGAAVGLLSHAILGRHGVLSLALPGGGDRIGRD